ncbi:site-specific integrase, partial [Acidithiobacillus sp.]|uniref:site-specific integrase n=1 Tax=Acidithiobacillus sp. TaxID=1872118 RepID=UPI003D020011
SEIMGLTWDRVDFRNHTVFLQDTKNGESRLVPLSVTAEDCLKRQRERLGAAKGRVWSYTTEGMRASYFKAVKKAGIEGLTFHDLRHEATSRLCERGLPIMTVQAITGHKSTQCSSGTRTSRLGLWWQRCEDCNLQPKVSAWHSGSAPICALPS